MLKNNGIDSKPPELFSSSDVNNNSVVAVTGATGFIGAALISKLTCSGWKVRALYRNKKGRVPPKSFNVEWIEGELNDDEALNRLVNQTHAVIHCAGAVRGTVRSDFDCVNEDGVFNIAQAISRQHRKPKLLLISSLAAREPELSFYSGSKWRGEQVIKSISNELDWTIFRPPAVYGPDDTELLPLFKSFSKGFAPLPTKGTSQFSVIYVDDLTDAIITWLHSKIESKQTFELDDGRVGGYDWNTVINISITTLRNGAPVRRIPIPTSLLFAFAYLNVNIAKVFKYAPMLTPGKIRELSHKSWLCSSAEFTKVTGWKPKFDLNKGLDSIFNVKPIKVKEL